MRRGPTALVIMGCRSWWHLGLPQWGISAVFFGDVGSWHFGRKQVLYSNMSIDPTLLEILVCPRDHGALDYDEHAQVLVNPRLGLAYPIEDGIPVMLVDAAQSWPKSSAE